MATSVWMIDAGEWPHGRDRYTHGISWTAHKALTIIVRVHHYSCYALISRYVTGVKCHNSLSHQSDVHGHMCGSNQMPRCLCSRCRCSPPSVTRQCVTVLFLASSEVQIAFWVSMRSCCLHRSGKSNCSLRQWPVIEQTYVHGSRNYRGFTHTYQPTGPYNPLLWRSGRGIYHRLSTADADEACLGVQWQLPSADGNGWSLRPCIKCDGGVRDMGKAGKSHSIMWGIRCGAQVQVRCKVPDVGWHLKSLSKWDIV